MKSPSEKTTAILGWAMLAFLTSMIIEPFVQPPVNFAKVRQGNAILEIATMGIWANTYIISDRDVQTNVSLRLPSSKLGQFESHCLTMTAGSKRIESDSDISTRLHCQGG